MSAAERFFLNKEDIWQFLREKQAIPNCKRWDEYDYCIMICERYLSEQIKTDRKFFTNSIREYLQL